MNGCNPNDRDENGRPIDPISLNPITPDRLIKIRSGRVFVCYDALTLLEWVRQQEADGYPPSLPHNNQLLTNADYERVVARLRALTHPIYYAALTTDSGQYQLLPSTFESQAALEFWLHEEWQRDANLRRWTIWLWRQELPSDVRIFQALHPDGSVTQQLIGLYEP